MKTEVSAAIEELKRQFSTSSVTAREDEQGGAYVLIDALSLGPRYKPESTWMGFQIPAQYPYADIYPVFIGAETARVDGVPFATPVTPGHQFQERAAIQVSRRSAAATQGTQTATAKVLKILDFLNGLP
jgi:hypothetical protein